MTSRKFDLAARSAEAEAKCRHFVRTGLLNRFDCTWDDSSLAFAEQAFAEAEIRLTKARLALDKHKAICTVHSN
jgi:hypothetical protein